MTVPCSVTSHTFNFCLTSYKNHFCPFLSHALSYPISFPFPIDSPTPPPLSFSPLDPLLSHTPPIPHRFSHTHTPLPPTPFSTKNHHLMLFSLLQKLQDSPQHITQHLLSPSFFNPFNSQEWPRQNFSLPYLYNIMQTSDENKEKYQLWDY